mgnify:CR=1 FL=1
MYECFHCGSQSVIWDCDYDYADYGLEGKGIIHTCHCMNCGARIEYYISLDEEGEDE